LIYALIAGFASSELLFFVERNIHDPSPFFGLPTAILIAVLTFAILYAVLLVVFSAARRYRISKAIVLVLIGVLTAVWMGVNYHQSLPHLADVCLGVQVGDPWTKAEDAFSTMQMRGISDRSNISSKKDDRIFINDGGVFCSFSRKGDGVSDVSLSYDGP
jgi:hypothetical protein